MQTTWRTSLIPQHQRTEFWKSAVCDAFLAMTPRIPHAHDFDASLEHIALDSSSLNRIKAPAHGVSRTVLDINRDPKQLFFLNLRPLGRCKVRQGEREHTAMPGELVLIDGCSPYEVDLPEDGELLSLAIPRESLIREFPQACDRTASKIEATAISQLLSQQMIELTRLSTIDANQSMQISNILTSMIAGSLTDLPLSASYGSSRRRMLHKLISIHFSDPEFGPSMAAQYAGLSVRTLHMEFAQSCSSFGLELLNYRLARAHQMLTRSHRPVLVSQIAKDCGFKSVENFSRNFRRKFGASPSLVRA